MEVSNEVKDRNHQNVDFLLVEVLFLEFGSFSCHHKMELFCYGAAGFLEVLAGK
jgi:hypothetical protein